MDRFEEELEDLLERIEREDPTVSIDGVGLSGELPGARMSAAEWAAKIARESVG